MLEGHVGVEAGGGEARGGELRAVEVVGAEVDVVEFEGGGDVGADGLGWW